VNKTFFPYYKTQKGQQLVEFALVAPILIFVLMIIIQLGHLFVLRNTLSSATRAALIQVSTKYNNLTETTLANKTTKMESELYNAIDDYLDEHNIPNSSDMQVKIATNTNNISMVYVTYMYKLIVPFLPNLTEIPLQAVQVIDNNYLQVNNFSSPFSTQQLSGFGSTSSVLTSGGVISGFPIRQNTAFLVSWYDNYNIESYTSNIYARLFNWFGIDLLPPNLRINLRTATLEVRSPYYNGGNWFNTQIPYVWVISSLGYSQVFFTKFNNTVDIQFMFSTNSGWALNTCDINDHYWSNSTNPKDSCPLIISQGGIIANWYPYLYKVNPINYDQFNHDLFDASLGYRWCGTGSTPACTSNQAASHTILEYALKGMVRNGVYCSNHGLNFSTEKDGIYENVINNGASTSYTYLQHYTAMTSDFNNFDGNFVINIYQPVINDGTNYYSAGMPYDPDKIMAGGPLFSPYQWAFRLNTSTGVLESGANNADIVDVYIDSDGDGIPNVWDNAPDWFDRDGNGILDGLQKTIGANDNNDLQIEDQAGAFTNTIGWTDYIFPVPGVTAITSMPYITSGLGYPSSATLNSTVTYSYVPNLIYADFKLYNGKLYMICDHDGSPTWQDDLDRQTHSWNLSPTSDLANKVNFIHGHICGSSICLNKSDELHNLDTNNFSTKNTRTPAGW